MLLNPGVAMTVENPYPEVTYQKRQFGVAGESVALAMANPPQAMLDAELVVDDNTTQEPVT